MKNYLSALLIVLLLASGAAAKTEQEFGDHLYELGNFPGAVYAYEKALFTETGRAQQEELKYKLAQAYYQNKNFQKATELLNFLAENGAPAIRQKAQFDLAGKYLKEGWFNFAALEFQDYAHLYRNDSALYLAGWSYLKDYNYDRAARLFADMEETFPHSNYGLAAQRLSAEARKGKNLPQKNPQAAQIMSMVLPGSGQIYAEAWQDGIISFLLNALTISLFLNAWQENRTGEALIWFSLETAWYFGGAYSGHNSARKFNDRQRQIHLENLEYEYQPEKLF